MPIEFNVKCFSVGNWNVTILILRPMVKTPCGYDTWLQRYSPKPIAYNYWTICNFYSTFNHQTWPGHRICKTILGGHNVQFSPSGSYKKLILSFFRHCDRCFSRSDHLALHMKRHPNQWQESSGGATTSPTPKTLAPSNKQHRQPVQKVQQSQHQKVQQQQKVQPVQQSQNEQQQQQYQVQKGHLQQQQVRKVQSMEQEMEFPPQQQFSFLQTLEEESMPYVPMTTTNTAYPETTATTSSFPEYTNYINPSIHGRKTPQLCQSLTELSQVISESLWATQSSWLKTEAIEGWIVLKSFIHHSAKKMSKWCRLD